MTRSIPSMSSSGNARPQSTTTMLSSYSKAVMFIPICSSPPSGITFSLDVPLRPLREAVRSCGFCTVFTAVLPLFFCCGFCCCLYLKFFCFGFCFFVLFSAGFLSWLLYLLGLNLLSRGILSLCVVCALFSFILFSILNQAPP